MKWFVLATLVDIRSSKAPHCLIRRSNRWQSITLYRRACSIERLLRSMPSGTRRCCQCAWRHNESA